MSEEELRTWERFKQLEPRAQLQDRTLKPDVRHLSGPRFAVIVDKGFQAPVVLGEGPTALQAYQDALDKWNPPEPRKPSYEELETSAQTREHIDLIRKYLRIAVVELLLRGETHDRSKLDRAEVDIFTEYTPKLKGTTYGSEEYKGYLKEMGVALTHHYQHNRHHPEFFERSMRGMNVIDFLELFIDWMASTKRHADGDILKSIEINQKRFGYSDDIADIFRNSIELFEKA